MKSFFSFLLFFFFSIISLNFYVWAETPEFQYKRSLSFEYGYLPFANDNKAVARFGLEQYYALSFFYDVNTDLIGENFSQVNAIYMRDLNFILMFYVSMYAVDVPFLFAYHEYGHAGRAQAAGMRPMMYFVKDLNSESEKKSAKKYHDFFSYYSVAHLWPIKSWEAGLGGGDIQRDNYGSAVPSYWGVVSTMGGVNNNLYFSELLGNEISLGKGHLVTAFSYYMSKIEVYSYVESEKKSGALKEYGGGDMTAVRKYYSEKNYKISFRDMQKYDLISLAASSSSYSYVFALFNYILNGDPVPPSMNIYGVHVPDVNMYLTHRGISYKFSSGYYSRQWFFPAGFETVMKGGRYYEISTGIGRIYNNYIIQGGTVISKGLGYYASMEKVFPQGPYGYSFTVGFTHYDKNTFEGERHIPSLEDNYFSGNTYEAKVSFLY